MNTKTEYTYMLLLSRLNLSNRVALAQQIFVDDVDDVTAMWLYYYAVDKIKL